MHLILYRLLTNTHHSDLFDSICKISGSHLRHLSWPRCGSCYRNMAARLLNSSSTGWRWFWTPVPSRTQRRRTAQKWYAAGPQSHWFHAAYRSRHPATDNLWIPLVFFFKSQKSKWLWYVLLILIFVNINRSSTCLIGFDWIAFLAKHVSTSFGHPKWPCRGYDQSQWMSLGRTWFCNQSRTSSAVTKNMAVLHQMVELH